MDGVLAARKKIVIGSEDIEYEQLSLGKEVPAIGVFQFLPKGRKGTKFKWRLPNFVARMFTIDFPNYRVIFPRTLRNEVAMPSGKLEDVVNGLMESEMFNDVIRNHNIRVLIAGSVYDDGYIGQDKISEIVIIDAKSKSITKKLSIRWASFRDMSFSSLYTGLCNHVYKNIIKKTKDDIDSILKKG